MTTAAIIAACTILIAGLFAVIVERTNERDEARTDVARLEAECNAHAAENARLTVEAQLTDPATATTVRVPLLRPVPVVRPDLSIVPPPRVSDDEWFARLYEENGDHRG